MMGGLRRRTALWGAVTSLSLTTGIRAGQGSDRNIRARLLHLFGSLSGAFAVGTSYLLLRPHEAPRDALLAAILARDPIARSGRADDRDFRDAVRTAIREDFAQGATVKLDGWVLSETEARLCALAVVA